MDIAVDLSVTPGSILYQHCFIITARLTSPHDERQRNNALPATLTP